MGFGLVMIIYTVGYNRLTTALEGSIISLFAEEICTCCDSQNDYIWTFVDCADVDSVEGGLF